MITEVAGEVLAKYNLITAFAFVGILVFFSYKLSNWLSAGRVHGSAIAITLGLVLAYFGGVFFGGNKGVADIALLSGVALLGGSMLRDFAIIATAFGADLSALKKAGLIGSLSIVIGVIASFMAGAVIALLFGYTDPVSITTIGAGAATYIVGPVTGSALGSSSDVIALSVAAGLVKSVVVMVGTPFVAKFIGLNNPTSAMIYGGLMGTTSGVAPLYFIYYCENDFWINA